MKCIYCGTELKPGCIYCSQCGKEVQLVPDYNILEDDYLNTLIDENPNQKNSNGSWEKNIPDAQNLSRDKNSPERFDQTQNTTSKSPVNNRENNKKPVKNKKSKKKLYIIIAFIIIVIMILTGIFFVYSVNKKSEQEKNPEYQISLAKDAINQGDIEKAIGFYKKAISLNDEDVNTKLNLANLYMKELDYEHALNLYKDILKYKPDNKDAYKNLIKIYEDKKDYDAIVKLSETTKDSSILDLFSAYMVTPPVFSEKAGEFDEFVDLKLSSNGGYDIYYTIDGTDPIKNGDLYAKPIELDEIGEYEVKAVCKNDKGLYSEVAGAKYKIDIPAPDMPSVSPDGGNFGAVTTVTVNVPENCKAYYTWDGTNPSANSDEYMEPIEIPQGNNILSVILIDERTNLQSTIYRGNFVYENN